MSDYLNNIKVLSGSDYVAPKYAGYVASIIVAYKKAMDEEIKRAEKALRLNEWFGTVGQKVCLRLKVESVRAFDGAYGMTYMNRMSDNEGRTFVWWTGQDLKEGAEVILKGSIKALDEYKGTKQTVLTRCKEVSEASWDKEVKAVSKANAKAGIA